MRKSFTKLNFKRSNQMKKEFENLDVSAACKIEILISSLNFQGKYVGKKTDTENTIRTCFLLRSCCSIKGVPRNLIDIDQN